MTTDQPLTHTRVSPVALPSLPPPPQFAQGTILTLRQQGHSRTNGQEYYAPAIVLQQYDDPYGSVECIVFDATSGTAYRHSYPLRDLTTFGDGNERQMRELQSNVGDVLFSPEEHERMQGDIERLTVEVAKLQKSVGQLVQALAAQTPNAKQQAQAPPPK